MRGQGGPRSICWDCANACGKCSWSRNFTPVKGWEAIPTKIIASKSFNASSYIVCACPKFDRDSTEYGLKWVKK